MSVLSFDEIHEGRQGGTQISGQQIVRVYTRAWNVLTSSSYDSAKTVLAYPSCPTVGAVHNSDLFAWCRSVTARNESFSKWMWRVEAQYSSERELSTNPLLDPAVITWGTELFQRPYVEDKDGDPIVNKAGMAFDPPPEGDDANWVVTVRKNVSAVPSWILTYRNAINSSQFTLDGVTIVAQAAKLQHIGIGEWQERNGIYFRQLEFQIHLRASWKLSVLNDGMLQKDPDDNTLRIACVDDEGQPVPAPVPLNADGEQLANPTIANVILLDFEIYNEVNFNSLPLT